MADGLLVVDTDLMIDFLRGSERGASTVEEWPRGDQIRLNLWPRGDQIRLNLGTPV